MTLTGPAFRLAVRVGENDTWHHGPLHSGIALRAHAAAPGRARDVPVPGRGAGPGSRRTADTRRPPAGLAGASVLRGVEGFGAGAVVHTSRLLSLGEDLPLAIVIVDSAERVRAFLPQLRELMTTGLATVEEVKVVHGTGGADGR